MLMNVFSGQGPAENGGQEAHVLSAELKFVIFEELARTRIISTSLCISTGIDQSLVSQL